VSRFSAAGDLLNSTKRSFRVAVSGYPSDAGALVVVIITTVKSAEVIKKLETDGWLLDRIKGSHHQFTHSSKPAVRLRRPRPPR
jgi:hypothetical protein